MKLKKSLAIFLAVLLISANALACAVVVEIGEKKVIPTDEQVAIFFDGKRENFIRELSFSQPSNKLGFLVPVPNLPEVEEIDAGIFDKLEKLTQPPRDTSHDNDLGGSKHSLSALTNSAVEVLERKEIAGYDVAILKAQSFDTLARWLKSNEFSIQDNQKNWVNSYINDKTKNWHFVAFRFVGKQNAMLSSKAIRIGFDTIQPFFPYKEPLQSVDSVKSRLLKIYLITPNSYSLKLENANSLDKVKFSFKAKKENSVQLLTSDLKTEINSVEFEKTKIQWFESFSKFPNMIINVYNDETLKRPQSDLIFVNDFEKAAP